MITKSNNPYKQKTLQIEDSLNNSHLDGDREVGVITSYLYGAHSVHQSPGFGFNHNAPASLFSSKVFDEQSDFNSCQWLTPKQRRLERLAVRIEDCAFMDWAVAKCENCGNIVSKKKVRFSCMSNFCQDEECIKNRVYHNLAKFRALGIRSKVLYHFVIGFKPVSRITNKLRRDYHQTLRQLFKEIEKTHPKIYAIAVRDINQSNNNFRVHYHIGALPVKDFRLLASSIARATKSVSASLKIDVGHHLIGYRDKIKMFDYFSKRCAGEFGHERDGNSFRYSDMMNLKDFFNTFYHTKSHFFYNLKARPEGTEFIKLLTNIPEKCPYCEGTKFRLSSINTFQKPPDLHCSKCDLNVDSRDWNYQLGVCRCCAERQSYDFKKAIELKHRLPKVAEGWKESGEEKVTNRILSEVLHGDKTSPLTIQNKNSGLSSENILEREGFI